MATQQTSDQARAMVARQKMARHAETLLGMLGNDGALFFATVMLELLASLSSSDPSAPLHPQLERIRASAQAGYSAITGEAERKIIVPPAGVRV